MPEGGADDEARIGRSPREPGDDGTYSESGGSRGSRGPRLVWVLVPLVAAAALGLASFAGDARITHELQLIVPPSAAEGALVPARARVFAGLESVTGPALVSAPVALEVQDATGQVLARAALGEPRAGLGDLEAHVQLPEGARGQAQWVARAYMSGLELVVRAPLRIGEARAPALLVSRPLRALQVLSHGPLRREGEAPAPSALRARVLGGACVPEERCTLLVHVGEPAASITIEGNASVTPASSTPSAPTSGVVRLEVTTHGPEAQLELVAHRGDEVVARRTLRLPVALGSHALRVRSRLLAEGTPEIALEGEGVDSCIFDVFQDGVWVRTGSRADCTTSAPGPWPALSAGIYRVQSRRDPFGTDSAGVATFVVQGAAEPADVVFSALARAALAIEPEDAFTRGIRERPADASSLTPAEREDIVSYLCAVLDQGIYEMPAPISSYEGSLARSRAAGTRLRIFSLVALALSGLVLLVAIGQRGFAATLRAGELLTRAGQDPAATRRSERRGVLSVVGSSVLLLLLISVIAIYVLVRAG